MAFVTSPTGEDHKLGIRSSGAASQNHAKLIALVQLRTGRKRPRLGRELQHKGFETETLPFAQKF